MQARTPIFFHQTLWISHDFAVINRFDIHTYHVGYWILFQISSLITIGGQEFRQLTFPGREACIDIRNGSVQDFNNWYFCFQRKLNTHYPLSLGLVYRLSPDWSLNQGDVYSFSTQRRAAFGTGVNQIRKLAILTMGPEQYRENVAWFLLLSLGN